MMSEHLRFSPDILSRLGEELVPDIDQGIIELVKNAYDADATECRITLHDLRSSAGCIRVSDNGRGMTERQIRDGWLIIGRSSKRDRTMTPGFGRIQVGDKGLGRLSALRLGREVILKTRPVSRPGVEYTLRLAWDDFDHAQVVEDVEVHITRSRTELSPGTDIEIAKIPTPIGRTTVNRLARSLILLSDPFAETEVQSTTRKHKKKISLPLDPGFSASLLTDEYSDLQAKVGQGYFKDAEHIIHCDLNVHGLARFAILDWKGDVLHEAPSTSAYQCPPFRFDLWTFILDGRSFSSRTSTLSEVREWLNHVGGVHIYEDGIRVPPYGAPGNDWLELNLRRVRSPEVRPSTNTSVGRVKLSNLSRSLVQKTDRVGYIENNAFLELKRCCSEALEWAARTRLHEREKSRQVEKAAVQHKSAQAMERLEQVLARAVPVTERKRVDVAIARYLKTTAQEAKTLREELQLYRSLATAGMTSAVFAHEIGRPLQLIDSGLAALQRMIPDHQGEKAAIRVRRILRAKARLESFVSIPLTLLSRGKRRSGRVDVNDCLERLLGLMSPIHEHFKVEVEFNPTSGYVYINGSEALLDGIVLNLLMNSINAFTRGDGPVGRRRIAIGTEYDGYYVSVRISDNAGGIDGVEVKDIWLPGVTTNPEGTGFGLTIVRDSVNDLGGAVDVVPLTDFGGAEFVVRLPPMRTFFE